jgi:hypothetical protein
VTLGGTKEDLKKRGPEERGGRSDGGRLSKKRSGEKLKKNP